MNNAKIWILITGIVAIASGFMIYSLMQSKAAEKAQFMVKMQEMASKIAQLEKLKDEIETVKKEKAELEAKYQSEIAGLESQISDSKKAETSSKAKIESLMREKDTLTKYIEGNKEITTKLNKTIERLKKELNASEENTRRPEPEESSPAKRDPMDDTEPASSTAPDEKQPAMGAKLAEEEMVDLGRIVVHPATNEAARVEHTNSLYGFIVLSAGTNDGLNKDTVVNITRNNRLIAKAVIKKARENTSSAVTLPEWTREEIRVGDIISVNSPAPLPKS